MELHARMSRSYGVIAACCLILEHASFILSGCCLSIYEKLPHSNMTKKGIWIVIGYMYVYDFDGFLIGLTSFLVLRIISHS